MLNCPVCHLILTESGRSWHCPGGHSFDLAKEGYLNLLVHRGKIPAIQGDTKEMLLARRRFLERGLYDSLVQALQAALRRAVPEGGVIADIGCGEGYYTRAFQAAGSYAVYGTDYSKEAVKMAARRQPEARFIVADTHAGLPFADASLDGLAVVFAPRNAAEFRRCVKPGGAVIVAIPLPEHLQEMRERYGLLGMEADKEARIASQFQGFSLVETREVRRRLVLDAEAVNDLLLMTPNAWFSTPDRKAEEGMETEMACRILIFR